ncbi:DUF3365 domain-containing protein [Mariniflexile ostreae]|uniref:DUF3365 domain-containing protein n=1 Tax=Mariniflexile ostreae TaxID=1520892 RepID=A0ABV5F9H6_9FLAO
MRIVLSIIVLMFLGSCKQSNKTSLSGGDDIQSNHPGKKLMETNCYVCHSPSASEEDRIGPPMIGIKRHYMEGGVTKEAFIDDIQNWIKNPTEENTKMPGAVMRFGVMPKTHYPEETICQIADYMFDFDIEAPEWFEAHYNKGRGNGRGKGSGMGKGKSVGQQKSKETLDNLTYSDRGLKYALSTKAILGKNLMGTIQKKGTHAALTFCNENAYPLTDSMSVVHRATIKRVSDKPRNPDNQANTKELEYIETFKKDFLNNHEPTPIVEDLGSQVQVYYPIATNAMCLQCHGKPNKNIEPQISKSLKLLYPNDKAIGYDINQVRGIWMVAFEK